MSAACPIWVVLGKRLNSDALTVEGKSRVDGLLSALQCRENSSVLIVFCGGVTAGQTVSEAQRMHEYFQQQRFGVTTRRCFVGATIHQHGREY